ncbi:DUF4981 domain-containing protein [Antarcticibacterium sp. 1MA-6-2]|uniref:DUF4981 domain-containing protein n=1 Tax=Antarcticibacterium sp. 1MA-6-2 TaxID=2908210 RepID=UPI001F2DF8AB|nr:DUF4981 domain-containing protein [Antarcticibacterium sp. 1MA-6-2]UJH92673.1 DUF4981 domain-containing protein [Antarcticibacterium sp. 1MA-6-2]
MRFKPRILVIKRCLVIFDEWAHVASYNNETIIEDPNTRNFWGQSLDRMWTKTFEAEGGLGGAIWGMIDETFMLPENLEGFRKWWGIEDNTVQTYKGTTVGYGEWGIVDVWRRKKPEFWNTKKAYSPIRIMNTTIEGYKEGDSLKIPVYNRFDHTNLNEVTLAYTYNGVTKTLSPFDLPPHTRGEISLPIAKWKADKKIAVEFYNNNEKLIDRYLLSQKPGKTARQINSEEKVEVNRADNVLNFITSNGIISLDATTGLITNIEKDGSNLAVSGPQMVYKTKGKAISYSSNQINNYSKNWNLNDINYALNNNEAVVTINGSYSSIIATFKIRIFYDGKIETTYSFENLPKEYVREVGVKYILEDAITTLSWERNGYWSAYPENHLSALSGKTNLYPNTLNEYRQKPEKLWNEDTKSFYYEGTNKENSSELTRIAKATKENVYKYSLGNDKNKLITVQGNGVLSCRLSKTNDHLELYLLNKLDYIDLSWGNYQRNFLLDGTYKGKAEFSLFPQ